MSFLSVNQLIYFCPDLDRGATFRIKNIQDIEGSPDTVSVTLIYIEGLWSPSGSNIFKLTVPCSFKLADIENAWLSVETV